MALSITCTKHQHSRTQFPPACRLSHHPVAGSPHFMRHWSIRKSRSTFNRVNDIVLPPWDVPAPMIPDSPPQGIMASQQRSTAMAHLAWTTKNAAAAETDHYHPIATWIPVAILLVDPFLLASHNKCPTLRALISSNFHSIPPTWGMAKGNPLGVDKEELPWMIYQQTPN